MPQLLEVQKAPTKASYQTPQVVRGNNNADFGVAGMWTKIELPVPVLILENATENTLIVTEKNESDQAAHCNAYLDNFAFSKPMSHCDELLRCASVRLYVE